VTKTIHLSTEEESLLLLGGL